MPIYEMHNFMHYFVITYTRILKKMETKIDIGKLVNYERRSNSVHVNR